MTGGLPSSSPFQLLKGQINRYTVLALVFSILTITLATMLVSLQLQGRVTLDGIIKAQLSNPALWLLDITPLVFMYWGQKFFHDLVYKSNDIITRQSALFAQKNNELSEKLQDEIVKDEITGLYNQKFLLQYLHAQNEGTEAPSQFMLVIISITNLKEISYQHGTYNTNALIKAFANNLLEIARSSLNRNDYLATMVARTQSDEFALILSDFDNDASHEAIITDICARLIPHQVIDRAPVKLQFATGATLSKIASKDGSSLLNQAVSAAFYAEINSIDFAFYDKTVMHQTQSKPLILLEVKKAITSRSIIINYQPTYDFTKNRIIGAEALARLQNDVFGTITADTFIPLIEGTKLMRELNMFVMEETISKLSQWLELDPSLFININLSADDTTDIGLPKIIQGILDKHQVPPQALHIAFTEKSCLENQSASIKVIHDLNHMGVTVAIDDFCSGHSSFVYMANFPIKQIKIDKSFVLYMLQDPNKRKIIQAIIGLAKIFNLSVSAEGVEDKETLQALISEGCMQGKGFYFSKAVSADDFEALLCEQAKEYTNVRSNV